MSFPHHTDGLRTIVASPPSVAGNGLINALRIIGGMRELGPRQWLVIGVGAFILVSTVVATLILMA